ncbi:anti-sigma factor [Micromonospora sp. HUAS LYJ1]|uniref:anti-sigma factor n=1 Tax=Micromonospora sp. HUAS LYJ1 TaxID=3061626 RepID=UPI0026739D65|nr:anti-sigma factor [Micromonospora sp. HUAS LYJ1]WKU04519.1 anti-sigma factor [Micromonospora sp. HUAS LYJ1]
MQHLDHDRLVFLALGESEADHGETDHLGGCVTCRHELESLRHVAGLGAGTQGLHTLPDPPAHLWAGILAELDAVEQMPSLAEAHRQDLGPDPTRAGPAAGDDVGPAYREAPAGTGDRHPSAGTGDGKPAAVSGDRPKSRRRSSSPGGGRVARPAAGRSRRWPRWATTVVSATAAAVIAVLGTVLVLGDRGATPQQDVLASAPLAAYGSTPKDARGDARVFADGRLHLHVANLPDVTGYYEVWLINPTTMEMFSVGVLRGSSGDALLPLPPNVDLRAYSVVDVSAEQYDNQPAHSGDSLLRGTLTG